MPDFVNYNNTDIESNLLVDANSPGLMSSDDKKKLNGLPGVWYGSEKEYDNLETKDSNVLYIIKPPLTTTLLSGSNFNTILKSIGPNATSVVFTKTAIPSDKISSATIVSTEDSDVNAYMYLDGDTIYVSPEEDNTIIYANENCTLMFNDCNKLTSLDLSNFDTSNVTNMTSMFNNCRALTSLDVSNFNTSKVTDMSSMFMSCRALTSLDVSNFNTSKVTNMEDMFSGCSSLTSLDVSNFNTSNVTNMTSMFNSCSSLTSLDVSNFNTSKVTDMSSMFNSCNNLTSLDLSNFNTSKVTDMSSMFNSCNNLTSLDLSNFDTSKVTSMSNMFNSCSSLTSLDVSNFNTSKVTRMGYMFSRCGVLSGSITITNPNITSYSRMFNYCSINAGSKFTVNYKSGCQTVAQKMVNTRSSNSNVVLGVQV